MVKAVIFCRECACVVAELPDRYVPNRYKCPHCGVEARVKWRKRKWDGTLDELTWFTAVRTQSAMAFRMKLCFPPPLTCHS
jgi:uncharacterized OB-fold protein